MKKFVAILMVLVLAISVCGVASAGGSGKEAKEMYEQAQQARMQSECDNDFADDPSYAGAYGYVVYTRTLWERIRDLFR